MLSDIRKKKRTEIDFINGYIVKIGHEYHFETPVNSFITSLIHMKENERS